MNNIANRIPAIEQDASQSYIDSSDYIRAVLHVQLRKEKRAARRLRKIKSQSAKRGYQS